MHLLYQNTYTKSIPKIDINLLSNCTQVISKNDDEYYDQRMDQMDLLKRLETKAGDYWRKANEARGLERQKLLQQHREAYRQYKRHKEWLAAMGGQI